MKAEIQSLVSRAVLGIWLWFLVFGIWAVLLQYSSADASESSVALYDSSGSLAYSWVIYNGPLEPLFASFSGSYFSYEKDPSTTEMAVLADIRDLLQVLLLTFWSVIFFKILNHRK